jgi:hypothetical protein
MAIQRAWHCGHHTVPRPVIRPRARMAVSLPSGAVKKTQKTAASVRRLI